MPKRFQYQVLAEPLQAAFMPTVAQAAAGANGTGVTNIPVTLPTGPQQGDLIYVVVGGVGAARTINAPDGTWTQLGTQQVSGTSAFASTFYKIAGAGEPSSWTFTFATAPTHYQWTARAIKGQRLAVFIDSNAQSTVALTSTPTGASVTPTKNNCLILTDLVCDSELGTFSCTTATFTQDCQATGGAASGQILGLHETLGTAAAVTPAFSGTRACTWVSFTTAIAPASPGNLDLTTTPAASATNLVGTPTSALDLGPTAASSSTNLTGTPTSALDMTTTGSGSVTSLTGAFTSKLDLLTTPASSVTTLAATPTSKLDLITTRASSVTNLAGLPRIALVPTPASSVTDLIGVTAPSGAPVLVQFNTNATSSGSTGAVVSLDNAPTPGNLVYVVLAANGAPAITAPDGTWTALGSFVANGSAVGGQAFYKVTPTGGPSSWTFTLASSQPYMYISREIANISTVAPFDTVASNGTNSAVTTPATPTITPSANKCMVFADFFGDSNTGTTTSNPPFGLDEKNKGATGGGQVLGEHELGGVSLPVLLSSRGTSPVITGSCTCTTPHNWVTFIAAIAPPGDSYLDMITTPARSATSLLGLINLTLVTTPARSATNLAGAATSRLDLVTTPATGVTNLVGTVSSRLDLATSPAISATNLVGLPRIGLATTPATSATNLVGLPSIALTATPATSATNLAGLPGIALVTAPAASATSLTGAATWVLDLATSPATSATDLEGTPTSGLATAPADALTALTGTPTSALDMPTTAAASVTSLAGTAASRLDLTASATTTDDIYSGDPLAAFRNNKGISNNLVPLGTGFDGASSYSYEALANAGVLPGSTVFSQGVAYTWPNTTPGNVDNVKSNGQVIALSAMPGAQWIGFLGASESGSRSGTATLTYTDGSASTFTLGMTDWFNSPTFGNVTAITVAYRNQSNGTPDNRPFHVFSTITPLDPARTLASVTLPVSSNSLHIFALGSADGTVLSGTPGIGVATTPAISITGLVSNSPSTSLPLLLQSKVGAPSSNLDLLTTPASSATGLTGKSILVLVTTPATSATSLAGATTFRLDLSGVPALSATSLTAAPTVIENGAAVLNGVGALVASATLSLFNTTLYLRDALTPVNHVQPTGYLGAWVDTLLGAAFAGAGAGTLFTAIGSGQLAHVVTGVFGTGGFAFPSVACAQYLSPPLIGQTIQPSTWTLALAASSTALPWQVLVTLLLIDGNTGAVKTTILATQPVGTWRTDSMGASLPLLLLNVAVAEQTVFAVLNGSTAVAAQGDYLVLEIGSTLSAQKQDTFTLDSDGTVAVVSDGAFISSAASALISGQPLALYTPVYGAAVLVGVGTVAAGGQQLIAGSATLAGVGTVTAPGGLAQAGATTASGIGALTALGNVASPFSAFYLGIGTAAVGDAIAPVGYFGGWNNVLIGAANAGSGAQALLFSAGSGEQSLAVTGAFANNGTVGVAQFCSLPLAPQTIPAQTWSLAYAMASANITWTPYVFVGVVNGLTGALRAQIVGTNVVGVPTGRTTLNEQACVGTFAGLAASVQAGDYLVLEVAHATTPAQASGTSTLYADGTTTMTTDGAAVSGARSVISVGTALLFPTHFVQAVAIVAATGAVVPGGGSAIPATATLTGVGTLTADAPVSLVLAATPATSATALAGTPRLDLATTPASSLTALAGATPASLDLGNTPASGATLLAGTPISTLDLGNVPAASATNLTGVHLLLSAATLSGVGAVTVASSWLGFAALAGTGTLVANAGVSSRAVLVGGGTFVATGPLVMAVTSASSAANLAGTPTSTLDLPATPALSATGLAGAPTLLGAAVLNGIGTAAAVNVVDGAAVLTASGTLVADLIPVLSNVAALSASGAVTASSTTLVAGAAVIAAVGTATPASTATVPGSVTLTARAVLVAANTGNIPGSAALFGAAALSAFSFNSTPGSATLAAVGTVAPSSISVVPAVAFIGAAGGVVALGVELLGSAAAALAASGAVTPLASQALPLSAATLAATGAATADASTALIAASATLSGVATAAPLGGMFLPGALAAITATGAVGGAALALVLATATLDAYASISTDASWSNPATLAASGAISGALTVLVYGQAVLAAVGAHFDVPPTYRISPFATVRATIAAKHIALTASQTLGGMMAVTALTPTDLDDLTIGDFYPITLGGTVLFPGEIVAAELLIKANAEDPDNAAIVAVNITGIASNAGVISQSGGQASGSFYMQFNLQSAQTSLLVNPGDPDPANPSMASYFVYGIKLVLQNGQPIRVVREGTITANPGVVHND